MAYRSSAHESTGFSLYRLMFVEECTLPMMSASLVRIRTYQTLLKNPMLYGSGTRWKWLMNRSVATLVRLCSGRSGSMISGLSAACFQWVIGLCV